LPPLSLVIGSLLAMAGGHPPEWTVVALVPLWALGLAAWCVGYRAEWATFTCVLLVCGSSGALLAARAENGALSPSLRVVLDELSPGFLLDDPWSAPLPEPVAARVVLTADAVRRDDAVSLRGSVTALRRRGSWTSADGGVSIRVGGAVSDETLAQWHHGVALELPVAFRRPPRFFNHGVPNAEWRRARAGGALNGSVKSGRLVEIIGVGSRLDRVAAETRRRVRGAVSRAFGPQSTAGRILAAVLIGDDAALPPELRQRWQSAGTYHVLAISGGNIVVIVCAALVLGRVGGWGPRGSAALALVAVLAFAAVVVPGASVRRAVWMAVLHVTARWLDHRAGSWQALAMATMALVVLDPLALLDPGFLLTCGATAVLVGGFAGLRSKASRGVTGWIAASVAASTAIEAVVLPVGLVFFQQVSIAGLVLNVAAVPVMTVVQVVGLALVVLDASGVPTSLPAWIVEQLVWSLDRGAGVASGVRWLAWHAPAPPLGVVAAYYAALTLWWMAAHRGLRWAAGVAACGLLMGMALGAHATAPPRRGAGLSVTLLDVGQGDAILVETDGRRLLVDTGGRPFGDGTDIGWRAVVPALWARGVRALDALLVTHADPDHVGGAIPVVQALRVGELWHGVEVPGHEPMRALRAQAEAASARVRALRAGVEWDWGRARLRVVHPPTPDWERRRVRNDDSVVLEVRYGDVAVLLTGDITAEVEREVLARLSPARVRVLKVAHHGSRTSTSQRFVDAWRPQIALVSNGRGNTFGHPAPPVLARLAAAGTDVFRTDTEGQLTLETDGRHVRMQSYRGRSMWRRP
jgi:competence protein ComEC